MRTQRQTARQPLVTIGRLIDASRVTNGRRSAMKRMHLFSLAVPLALLAGVTSAAAQARLPEVLNVIELRQLVTSAEPADHARLGAHFAALAEQYTADAARHTAMSKAFGGNPNRSGAVAASAHCARLARLNTESAVTLRELAEHHERLAMGVAATVPP